VCYVGILKMIFLKFRLKFQLHFVSNGTCKMLLINELNKISYVEVLFLNLVFCLCRLALVK
jgi:hypothetical protein